MDVTPLIRQGQQVIQSYAGGQFRVSGIVYQSAIIVTPEETFVWDAPADFADLTIGHFIPLTQASPGGRGLFADVILLGTGKTMRLLPPDLKRNLKIQIDVMDTGAACRTYNVLMAEGRRVAAALLPYS